MNKKTKVVIGIVLVMVGSLLLITFAIEILGIRLSYFEDGSFRIVGCLPGATCT